MKKSILLLLSIVALVCWSDVRGHSVTPLKIRGDVSLVTVQVGDVVIPDILLDTGFAFDGLMIYNPDYKDSLDLTDAMEVQIPGAGSGKPSRALMIESGDFSMGDVLMTNQRILVLEGDLYKGFPSNGIMGYSIFGHYVTEFDYDNNTMTLHDTLGVEIDDGWTTIPLYFKDNMIPWMDASVVIEDEEPISVSTYIDYADGDPVTLLEKPGQKFRPPKETADAHLGTGLSGDIYGKTGKIAKLIIGPYELKNVKASFAPAEVRSKQDNADAILGNGSLRRFNLIFDYSNKKLHLKPNKHFDDPFN